MYFYKDLLIIYLPILLNYLFIYNLIIISSHPIPSPRSKIKTVLYILPFEKGEACDIISNLTSPHHFPHPLFRVDHPLTPSDSYDPLCHHQLHSYTTTRLHNHQTTPLPIHWSQDLSRASNTLTFLSFFLQPHTNNYLFLTFWISRTRSDTVFRRLRPSPTQPHPLTILTWRITRTTCHPRRI